MNRRVAIRAAAVAGATVVMALPMVQAQAASAREWDYGVESGAPPKGTPCTDVQDGADNAVGAQACFQAYGDVFWVKDLRKDGKSGVAEWRDYPALYTAYQRNGVCINSHGYNTWAKCNKDLPENSDVQLRGLTYDGDTGDFSGPYSPWSRKIAANG